MSPPLGNKNAVGNKGGRPTKYKKAYCEELISFFSVEPHRREAVSESNAYDKEGGVKFNKVEYKRVPNDLPTLSKFATKIGIDTTTLYEWQEKHIEFSNALRRARELYKDFLTENGLLGLYNGAFAIFIAKNTTDMKDKSEVEVSFSLSKLFDASNDESKADNSKHVA